MLNNEFRFIGTIVSEYEKIGTEDFPKYLLTIEVERRKKGKASEFKLTVYEKNYTIDVNTSVKGKQVIATGYVDEYKGNYHFILQDMIVVGAAALEIKDDVAPLAPAIENNDVSALDLPDDDLPF